MTNLDQVNMFIAFLELVQNPEKYKEMLEEMQASSKELKEYTEAYTDVKSANKYFDKLKVAYNLKVDEFTQKEKDFEERKMAMEQAVAKRAEALDNRQKDLDKRSIVLADQALSLEEKDATLKKWSEQLKKDQDSVEQRAVEMQVRLKALAEKEAKLKAVLGS